MFYWKKVFLKGSRFRTRTKWFEEKFFLVFLWKDGRSRLVNNFIEKKLFLKGSRFRTRTGCFRKKIFSQFSFEETAESRLENMSESFFWKTWQSSSFFWKKGRIQRKKELVFNFLEKYQSSKIFFWKELLFKVFLRVIQSITCVGFIPSRGTSPG